MTGWHPPEVWPAGGGCHRWTARISALRGVGSRPGTPVVARFHL